MKRFSLFSWGILLFMSFAAAQTTSDFNAADYELPVENNEIKIVSYNVQNLYDTEHDEGKNDWQFLPKNHPLKNRGCSEIGEKRKEECLSTDWTQEKLNIKIRGIRKVLQAQGPLPDVLALVEIENHNVIAQLARVLGYAHFLVTESADSRGADVALLYKTDKLRLLSHREVEFDTKKTFPTRNILIANFAVNGDADRVLGVFVNHWAAQMAPNDARMIAADYLREAVKAETLRYGADKYHVLAAGDFNTHENDMPHALKNHITDPNRADRLVDIYDLLHRARPEEKSPVQSMMPPASYFYPGALEWQSFDRFLTSRNLTERDGKLSLVKSSFRIVAPAFVTRELKITGSTLHFAGSTVRGIPKRFDFFGGRGDDHGYSDHFPIAVKIRF